MTVDNNNSPVTCHEGFDLDNDKASLAALINSIGSSFSPGDLLPVEKQTLTAVETEDRFLVEDSTVEVSLARSTKSKTTGEDTIGPNKALMVRYQHNVSRY